MPQSLAAISAGRGRTTEQRTRTIGARILPRSILTGPAGTDWHPTEWDAELLCARKFVQSTGLVGCARDHRRGNDAATEECVRTCVLQTCTCCDRSASCVSKPGMAMSWTWLSLAVVATAAGLFFHSLRRGDVFDPFQEGRMTLTIVKPNAFHRRREILALIQDRGVEVHRSKELSLSKAQVEAFYHEHRHRPFFEELVEFMCSGTVLVALFHGDDAVRRVRRALGPTDPEEARKRMESGQENTVRAMYGWDVTRNAAHASDSPASAWREASLLFPEAVSWKEKE